MMNRVSAREFIGRLKGAEEGALQAERFDGNVELKLIVTEPEKAAGEFHAPGVNQFDYDYAWYSAFYEEAVRLTGMQMKERIKCRLRVILPHQ